MTVVDPTNDTGDLEGLEKSLQEAVKMDPKAEEEIDHTPEDNRIGDVHGEDLPEKYQGKTIQDVIEMHRNLESAYGRQSNDLGTQRKLTDRLLDLKRTDDLDSNSPEPLPEVSGVDLLDNPTEALDTYLGAREARVADATETRLAEVEAALMQERFRARHPDFDAVVNDQAFQTWLQSSPLKAQAAQAAAAGNLQVADLLLQEYKQSSPKPTGSAEAEDLEAARQASLTTSQSSSDGASSSNKKTYRRADLIRLRLEKPSVYEDPQFQTEILAAYAEGRVK